MVKAAIVSIIDFCTKYASGAIAVAVTIGCISGFYAEQRFAINTDINTLISDNLPWRQRELAFEKSFSERYRYMLAVVDAPSTELVALARSALADKLAGDTRLFTSVRQLGGTGGLIAIDKNGEIALPFNTNGMYRGYVDPKGKFVVEIYR